MARQRQPQGLPQMTPQQMRDLATAQKEVAAAFERTTQAMRGWATAGLAGTTMGEKLLFQQQMLRREITQLFLPAIEKVSQWLDRIIQKFRQLTGTQQESIGRWLLSATAMLGLITLMPRIVAWIETLRNSWRALTLVMAANPFLMVAAGVAVLMAQTEEGRSQLQEIGTQLFKVFEEVAAVLGQVLLPILEQLTEILSSGTGKIIIWGAVFVMAIRTVQAAFSGLALTMLGAGAILGGLVGAVGLLALAFGKTEFRQFGDTIAKQVRAGKMSLDQAMQELEAKSIERQQDLEQMNREVPSTAEGWRRAAVSQTVKPWGISSDELARRQAVYELEQEKERARQAASKAAKGRNDLLLAQTAQEDPRQTIQRIQSNALRIQTPTDKNTERTADATEMTAKMVQQIVDAIMRGANGDNRDQPPKGD